MTKKQMRVFLEMSNPYKGKNLLNLSDNDILILYVNTKLTNEVFCSLVTKMCKRSIHSIKAFLVMKNVYRLA